MRQDLFYIPHELFGLPVFGPGWLLILWAVGSAVLLAWLLRRQGWNAETRSYLPLLLIAGVVICWLLPKLEVRPPVGPPKGLPIRGYGVMLLIAVVSSVGLAIRESRRAGFDPDVILSLCFHLFVGGIIGARVFYVVEYWPDFQRDTAWHTLGAILNVTEGGLVVYGSFFGALIPAAWFVRRHGLPALATADVLAASLMLGAAVGRVGCLLNGCCHGGLCHTESLAVTFPAGSPPYVQQRELGQLHGFRIGPGADGASVVVQRVDAGGPAAAAGLAVGSTIRAINDRTISSLKLAKRLLGEAAPAVRLVTDRGPLTVAIPQLPARSLPVHPAQIYGAISAGLIGFFLWAYYPFRRRDGEVFCWLLTLYPLTRFLLEVVRVDEPGQFGTLLSIGQWISLLLLAVTAGLWVHVLRQPRRSVLATASV